MESKMKKDWIEVELEEICQINLGQSPPSSTYNDKEVGLPFFQGKAEFTDFHPKVVKWCSKPKKIAEKGDVLLSVRAPVGSTNIADQTCAIGRGLAAIRYPFGYKFPWYFLKLIEKKLDSLGTGTTFKAISGQTLKSQIIPLPPLPEQRAIVARIEELFSELDHAIANLKSAQAKLEIYRQAVLKKAFEGGLTEEWRRLNHVSISAKGLLKEIRDEQERWIKEETILGNSEANRLKSKLKKVKSDFSTLEELPFGWTWTTFLESSNLVVDCHNKTAPYQSEGIFLVRTTNVKKGALNLSNGIKFVSQETFEYWSRRCVPRSGDILFTREAPMGEVAIIPENTKICLGQRMMLIRVFNNLVNKKYLYYAIQDPSFQQRMDKSAIGTGVKHLRVGDVENLIFPICSPEEQTQIVQEIESRLSVADKLAETIQINLLKSESLRQSILKQAFEGKLLTEAELDACRKEADWEHAEKLLERIKGGKKSKNNYG
ncbi:restriction endonuclease subunit S [Algoriphagus aquimarinus]|uniref:restriction endonuclease subunit S n=1 Tax=Algoriphagus aquimarinus TaxID=237018 RepID=UPI0030DC33B6